MQRLRMKAWKLSSLVLLCFVDGQAALSAFEISCRFLKGVLISRLWVLLLHLHQLLDGAGSGDLLANWLVGSEIGFQGLVCQEFTVLLKVTLKDLHSKCLMHSGVAGVALVTAPVCLPLVFVGLPWELTLVDEPFLVLLGVVPCSADWLLVDIVLWIFVDLLQSCCGLRVDPKVILVQRLLPVLRMLVIYRGGPFASRKGSIPLASP